VLFTIRNSFEDADFPALYEIEKECFPPEFRWAEPVFKQEVMAARQRKLVWVAYIGSKIAGFLVAGQEGNKLSMETCNTSRIHRRKGVASKLIAAYEKAAKQRGIKEVKLEVYTENPAQILYFGLGYRVSGFKRNYYGLKRHAVSMSKKLT
jgi:ribosomal protein S18 acetylase RimI-like enzyme